MASRRALGLGESLTIPRSIEKAGAERLDATRCKLESTTGSAGFAFNRSNAIARARSKLFRKYAAMISCCKLTSGSELWKIDTLNGGGGAGTAGAGGGDGTGGGGKEN